MPSVNKVILIGHAGKDAEVKNFDNGGKIVKFSLATSEKWKDKNTGEQKDRTDWHNISISNPNLINYASKVKQGDTVLIEGKNRVKLQEKDGKKTYYHEVELSYSGNFSILKNSKSSTSSSFGGSYEQQSKGF